jgi:hypothetical protein
MFQNFKELWQNLIARKNVSEDEATSKVVEVLTKELESASKQIETLRKDYEALRKLYEARRNFTEPDGTPHVESADGRSKQRSAKQIEAYQRNFAKRGKAKPLERKSILYDRIFECK